VAPIKYTGLSELQHDIDNLKAGLQEAQVEEAFLPVAAPSSAIPDRKYRLRFRAGGAEPARSSLDHLG